MVILCILSTDLAVCVCLYICIYIYIYIYTRGWSQKKCTRWQHCVNNDAICPAISAVVLENFWKLVQYNWSPEVCARGNDRALKWRLFVSQVPSLMAISARTSKLKHYAGKLQRISAKGGCYWRNLDPGFRAWIEISVQWVERQKFPETEKIQEGPA